MTGEIERVVVTLDAASENRAAIDTAARLAARSGVPLHAVFVEEEDLLNLASLPFARQITLWAGAQALTREQAELNLRAEAERARRDVLAAARRHGVDASFEIVRGSPDSAMSAASERDLVVAGATTRPVAGYFRVEGHWWSSIAHARGPLLLARQAWSSAGSIALLLHDLGPGSVRLFEAAVRIAEASGATLIVLCPAAIASDEFEAWVAERTARRGARIQVEAAPDDPGNLQQRIAELRCTLLAVEASVAEGGNIRLREMVERFSCDVLVVR